MKCLFSLLVLLFGAAPSVMGATAECSEQELPAGTVLSDGTLAGETPALEYFKEKEPGLYSRLTAIPLNEMRKDYGRFFEWFQRVGNCRKRQKQNMTVQLNARLSLADAVAKYRKSADAKQKTDLRLKIRRTLEDLSESELALMRHNVSSMKESVKELQKDIERAESDISQKQKNRALDAESQMRELGIR